MDKNELIKILEDWNFWSKDLPTGINRDFYLRVLKEMLVSEQIKVITGARRSGKSYIMRQLAKHLIEGSANKSNILIVNFEDPRFVGLDTKLLGQIFDTYLEYQAPQGKIYVFLDEAQEIPKWEKWVRTMQELGKADIIASGSNSKMLSGELATVLTGRHLDTTVLPLSWTEFLKFKNLPIKDNFEFIRNEIKVKSLFSEFMERGSFPLVVLGQDQDKEKILLAYFDDIVNKDLVKRYKIRKSEAIKSLVKFYLSNISSPATFTSSGKFLNLSALSTQRFSAYLEASYLVFFLKRFSFKFKEQEKSPRKVYAIDTGLANVVGFRFSGNSGRLAENAVFLELKRKSYSNPGMEIYYWKSRSQEEVDFVVKENTDIKQLIQVCWDTQSINTKKRETKALIKAMDEFGLKTGLIITQDYEAEENFDGKKIQYATLIKWLLGL